MIPAAVEQIRRREDPNRTFYNSVSISSVTIPVSSEYEDNSVWGIATWTGVDPRSDFLLGLRSGADQRLPLAGPAGGVSGRRPADDAVAGLPHKTLQLNFWRAGDAIDTREDEIRFGVPNQNEVPAVKGDDEILKTIASKNGLITSGSIARFRDSYRER